MWRDFHLRKVEVFFHRPWKNTSIPDGRLLSLGHLFIGLLSPASSQSMTLLENPSLCFAEWAYKEDRLVLVVLTMEVSTEKKFCEIRHSQRLWSLNCSISSSGYKNELALC